MSFFDKNKKTNTDAKEKAEKECKAKKREAEREILANLREKGIKAYGFGAILAIVLLAIATLSLGVFSVVLYNSNLSYKATTAAAYHKAYYQLLTDANNLETTLSKAVAISGSKLRKEVLSEASSHALSAANSLAVIPSEREEDKEKIFKFFNQAMDFSKYLAAKTSDGEPLTDEEENSLKEILSTAKTLKSSLNSAYEAYGDNQNLFSSYKTPFGEIAINPVEISFDDLKESSIEYPTLIYDGPFSDMKEEAEKDLDGKSHVTLEEAKARVEKIFAESEIYSLEEYEGSELAYSFAIGEGKNQKLVQMTKEKGELVCYSSYKEIGEIRLSEEEGIKKAEEFLQKLAYDDLSPVWKSSVDGRLTVNFAQKVGEAVCYSRLLKISVALDNGDIIGLECSTYLSKRDEKIDTTAAITESEAKKALSENLGIKTARLAVIPKNRKEILAYEFCSELDGMTFYVYVDAKTGVEVEVLRVIENEAQGETVI